MAENDSPENVAKKWFMLTVVGAAIYVSVVFMFVIRGNDATADHAADAKVEQHD